MTLMATELMRAASLALGERIQSASVVEADDGSVRLRVVLLPSVLSFECEVGLLIELENQG